MGYMFMRPYVDNNGVAVGGLVTNLQMDTPVSESYFGDTLVYPYYPFPSGNIVAWWNPVALPPISSSTDRFIEWESYYSNTGNTYYLTGSVSNIDYTKDYVGGGVGRPKAIYHFSNYVFTDLNNIFTTSSTVTIILAGRTSAYSPSQNRSTSWYGMTGDNDFYIGVKGNPNEYTLKRDEDASAVAWFGQPGQAPAITSLTYDSVTGDYSVYQNRFGTTTNLTKAGASSRLGSTQQLRIGGWVVSVGGLLFTSFECIVLNYKPTTTELEAYYNYTRNAFYTMY
jgi:hypothetical protein